MRLRPPLRALAASALLLAALLLVAAPPQAAHAQEAHAQEDAAQEDAAQEDAARTSALSVEQIMQDPATWIGDWPEDVRWAESGDAVYFDWNPQGRFPADSLFVVRLDGGTPSDPQKVAPAARRAGIAFFDGWHHGEHVYTADFRRKVFAQDGDLFVYDRDADAVTRLTQTRAAEAGPRFGRDGARVIFEEDANLFALTLATGALRQLTDLRRGDDPDRETEDAQADFLEAQQRTLFDVLREAAEEEAAREAAEARARRAAGAPTTFYTGERRVQQLRLDPTERYVAFSLYDAPADPEPTVIVDYVTETGYAETQPARPKVGSNAGASTLYLQDLARDTTFAVDLHQLPGAYDVPAYLRDQGVERDSSEARGEASSPRALFAYGPYWSADGQHAVLEVRARDNKDRWLARLDPATGALTVLDRQHDDAWIAGPGISWFGGPSTMGWLPDDRRFFFQSEATGYSHLYTVDVPTGEVTQVTSGDFEVYHPQLSQDGQTWTFESSAASPFERHLYRLPVGGGSPERITTEPGEYRGTVGPNGTRVAALYEFTNQPPEVYLLGLPRPNVRVRAPQRLTTSPTDAWRRYAWRAAEIVRFEASDGVEVPAQVFRPDAPNADGDRGANGAAVLFVHGAGYLHNVHRGWSSYFREYLFHNLLTDLGYTVLNVDYRGSAGYGRDWRTAIYRHMGGRDLQDYVDAQRYVEATYGIPGERTFIYGGSYGGFLTLMALFTEADHFGGGAALRSVTDWAHYNDPYTANILNTPATDSLAYARSSPIYVADGLADPLLMAHGLVDRNVQPQDIFRLAQRLIELGKTGWELALYPVEGHGFEEPTSWTDEYRRILELIEATVGRE